MYNEVHLKRSAREPRLRSFFYFLIDKMMERTFGGLQYIDVELLNGAKKCDLNFADAIVLA